MDMGVNVGVMVGVGPRVDVTVGGWVSEAVAVIGTSAPFSFPACRVMAMIVAA